jgi:hypothetical protein
VSNPNTLPAVEVPFQGDTLVAVRDPAGEVWVAVNHICESLGVAAAGQRRNLRGRPWATVGDMPTVGRDGKVRDQACLPLRRLAMWLATLQPGKVRSELKERLELYQLEAAEALDRLFGPPLGSALSADAARLLEEQRTIFTGLADRHDARGDDLGPGAGDVSLHKVGTAHLSGKIMGVRYATKTESSRLATKDQPA